MTQPIELDLMEDLDNIQRGWIRRPMVVVLAIPTFVIIAVVGVVLGALEAIGIWWKEYIIDCWRGPNGS